LSTQISRRSDFALFELGFRPFFLLAGLYAVVPMAIWLLEYGLGISLRSRWGGMFFHGHEMVFGFTSAVIAGFLLTAVPNWTGSAAIRGSRLIGLVALWLFGRVAMFGSAYLSSSWVAMLDLAFMPALIAALTPSLYRARQLRNAFVPIVLTAFFVANLCSQLGSSRSDGDLTRLGLRGGAYLAVLLILIIGARIVPLFTANALGRAGVQVPLRSPGWAKATNVSLALAALGSDLFSAPSGVVAGFSAAAGLAIVWRLSRWHGLQARHWPIVWVMHFGYGFVALGFFSLAASRWSGMLPWSAAFHVFTSGAIGTMSLAMMSRVALGHTGRPLQVSPMVVLAYALVIVGAMVRSFVPLFGPAAVQAGVISGGVLWVTGYALFVLAYASILLEPRVDRPA